MNIKFDSLSYIISISFWISTGVLLSSDESAAEDVKKPTVVIAILARNKGHTLPYFLTLLQNLDYPKDRISLWIRSDHNEDNTIEVLRTWLDFERGKYHSVDFSYNETATKISGENGIADWTLERFEHVINLREEALAYARRIWADFIFMLDADVFLTNPKSLTRLILKDKVIVAPLVKSTGMYSNFWAGMKENYYYKRTELYKTIMDHTEIGCFPVPMIHAAVLINLNKNQSDLLTYKDAKLQGTRRYDGPKDDIITFAVGANISGVPLHVCNDQLYGYTPVTLSREGTFLEDKQRLTDLKLKVFDDENEIPLSDSMARFVEYPEKDKLGMDKIYLINLLRRPERLERMEKCFKELGILAETLEAVDGKTLNESSLRDWGITLMSEFRDPYHKRPMTMGEIGCFLSHYLIWKKVIDNGYERIMILEDDIQFEPYFRQKLEFTMTELERLNIDWDLIYLGRKRLQKQEEERVEGSTNLVVVGYSYWTLGYLLSRRGAEKLLDGKPLEHMIPVDEYLPILFDKHPQTEWKNHFPERNLIALAVSPLIIWPTHGTGQDGYISDTEDSIIIGPTLTDRASSDEL